MRSGVKLSLLPVRTVHLCHRFVALIAMLSTLAIAAIRGNELHY
jgi:hypothetical protein